MTDWMYKTMVVTSELRLLPMVKIEEEQLRLHWIEEEQLRLLKIENDYRTFEQSYYSAVERTTL